MTKAGLRCIQYFSNRKPVYRSTQNVVNTEEKKIYLKAEHMLGNWVTCWTDQAIEMNIIWEPLIKQAQKKMQYEVR